MSLNITSLPSIPSMSALLGSKGDTALLQSINKISGSSYFGSNTDRYAPQYNNFIKKFVDPIRIANNAIQAVASRLNNLDEIRPIQTEEDLRNLPPCMMLPVITDDRVYSLLRQGRIDGWGFSPEYLEDEKEMWDRLIDKNGVIDIGEEDPEGDDPEIYVERYEIDLHDPELTHEDRIHLMETREYVRKILDTTDLDPTDMDNLRG